MEKNKRIGILTIHAAVNFGSALQAYALQNAVATMTDDDVELIDYLPPRIMDGYSLNPLKHMGDPKAFAKYCITFSDRKKRNRAFRKFSQEYMRTSPGQYTGNGRLNNDSANWDLCLLGSDQVWNPDIVGWDRAFWLDFAENSYKASFASSFGTTAIPEDYRRALVEALGGFDRIAVREPSAAAMLSDAGKPIAVTCDPVFLLSAEQWTALERKPEHVPDHYMLLYTVERNVKLEELVKAAAAHYGIPVVDLGMRSNPRGYFGIHSPEYGPREFLYLIRHADYMVTNSFHGTAFGTIFKKKCISILHHSRGTRIRELAEQAGRTRYILPEDATAADVIRAFETQQEDDDAILIERIETSKAYLKEMLADARSAKTGI